MAVLTCNTITNSEGQEISRHGTLSFPAAAYDDGEPVLLHWHDELEAVNVIHGIVSITAGTHKINLSDGEGLFISGGVIHDAHSLGGKFKIRSIVFSQDIICGGQVSIFREKYISPLIRNVEFVKLSQESLESFSLAWSAFEREDFGYEFYVRENLSRMLLSICENLKPQAKISSLERRRTERVKIMLIFIHEHFAEKISTNDIARSASVSSSECLRCFHSILHTTPADYLRNYRLTKAEQLLASTEINIADVADICGFHDVSYFTKIFREKKALTPSQFRVDNIRHYSV